MLAIFVAVFAVSLVLALELAFVLYLFTAGALASP